MKTIDTQPHILFLLDNLHMHKAGLYGLVRWTIRMLRSCTSTERVRITCTSCASSKDTNCDDAYTDFCREFNVHTLSPSKLGYALRGNENKLHVDDLNRHDKQYFRILKDNDGRLLNDVSHIVAIAPLTEECCLRGGIVDRIKALSKCAPKVIMLNQMADPDWISSYENSALSGKIDHMICIGNRIYNRWLSQTSAQSAASQLLYPTFDEISTHVQAVDIPSNHFKIVTMYSKYLHDNNTFLKHLAQDIGTSVQRLNSEWTVEWFIQWSYDDIETQDKELHEHKLQQYSGCLRERLKIELMSKSKDISPILSICALCIQPGYFDTDGYSGLEMLLAGIPTLVLPLSDVHHIILQVNKDAEYFAYDRDSPRIHDKIKSRLKENQDAFDKHAQFQKIYCKYRGSNNFSTVKGIKQYLNMLTGKRIIFT